MRIRALAWSVCLAPAPALAHSPVPGLEGLYVGLLHPYSTPAQAVTILSAALLSGSFPADKARWLVLGFLAASLIGLMIGPVIDDLSVGLFACALAISVLAAMQPGKVWPLAAAAIAIGGAVIGQASLPDPGPVRDRLFTMSGSIIGANLGLLYLFGLVHVLRKRNDAAWLPIAFRITAAWIGAVSLVMLALTYAAGSAAI